mgnify:CR=1 FL=1
MSGLIALSTLALTELRLNTNEYGDEEALIIAKSQPKLRLL